MLMDGSQLLEAFGWRFRHDSAIEAWQVLEGTHDGCS